MYVPPVNLKCSRLYGSENRTYQPCLVRIVGLLILITQKKSFDALNATEKKPPSLLQSTVNEKIKKKHAKMVKNDQMVKNYSFCLFLIFSEMVLWRELGFFAFHSVHQNPSFELSKSTIRQFFTLRRYAFDLGEVKLYLHDLKWLRLYK